MPQIYLFLVFLFSANLLVAQDTVRVQTFTWEDETRSKMFQFPDTDDTYEQILMRYNMRCHDADIRTDNRGGYFGCGEWDYSCNTFVYDPTREDSVKATHPSHLISGFDGDEFVYRDTPPYDYYQYTQYVSNFVDTTSLTVGEIGAAGPGDDRLFANQVLRWQYLYRAEELLAAGLSAGPISAMQLYVTSGGANLNFLRLSLQNVSVDSLSEDEPITTGFTQVYFRTTRLEGEGSWQSFPFYESFYWDGESNLLLNVSMKSSGVEEEVRRTSQTTDFPSAAAPVPETLDHYLALNGNGWMELDIASGPATEEITIAFWAKGQAAALGRNTSVFEGVDGLGQRQLNVHLPWNNNRIYWDCGNDGTGYDRIEKDADPSILAGQWNHWAFTKDAVSGQMAIYLNGELWHSGTDKHRPISGLERTVFGANANYGNRWPGGIDHVSFTASALSAEEIRAIMFKQRPSIAEVGAHFSLNEGEGLTAAANSPSYTAQLFGPNWKEYAPEDQRFDWYLTPFRWHVRFDQGQHLLQNEPVTVLDSQLVSPLTVREFEVNEENDLVQTSQYETYPVHTFVYDEDGEVIDDNYVSSDGIIYISELDYHRKTPAKFEILSLVTPYGIGLDLGAAGKTFTFDVTDYAPILRGEKRLSLEMGGQNQEEMNIEFLFIKGTPSREVLDIANVWPFARGNYAAVQADEVFEPRNMRLDPAAGAYKLRASITGHGQNGEFIPRQHYLNLNGGAQDFQFDVWKACSQNPVYPQGGTWIFDRAGWCPGMATDVHEYFLPENIGAEVEVDYGVNGATMDQANYLVATQLVTYGPRSFELDAKIVDIIRPSTKVEYERINPICDDPVIRVRNTGGTTITSMRIDYGPTGNEALSYDWEGNLAPDEEAEIVLPVDYYRFWTDVNFDARFGVELANVNGTVDDYSANNVMITDFAPTDVFDFDDPLVFEFQTNLRPGENRYTITNAAGEVVMQRANLTASTRYRETIDLPPGCYRLTFFDDGGDGLDFWYWAAVGQSRGTGSLSMRRQITNNLLPILHRFNPDYGGDLYYDFVIPDLLDNTEELTEARRFSIYPNPARTYTVMELTGFAGKEVNWSLHTAQGVVVAQGTQQVIGETENIEINLERLPAGLYLAKVKAGEEWFTREVVVLH